MAALTVVSPAAQRLTILPLLQQDVGPRGSTIHGAQTDESGSVARLLNHLVALDLVTHVDVGVVGQR